MQKASKEYKASMNATFRNRGYIKAIIGVINSEAQKNATADTGQNSLTYYSDPNKPFQGYTVDNVYATAEQGFSKVDGSMYFLPGIGGEYYNNGIVTNDLNGSIYISFQGVSGLDIKGLTIDFGKYYPVDFTIENDTVKREYYGNASGNFVTEDVFDGTSFFIITPIKMVNDGLRLRIYQFSCGIVNTFTNKEVKSYSNKEHVSSITETIPSTDVTLTVDNQSQYYSPDNPESTLAYFEVGQEVKVSFGYDVNNDGNIEWLPEQTSYLKKWSATDTEAKFTATDRFDSMTGTYHKGSYSESGISLYNLAVDVLADAGITDEREFFIDPYLKDILVNNPVPVVKHSQALQIIANAGRCALFEDRQSRIHMKFSYLPDMIATSNGETEYSHVKNVLVDDEKDAYAIASNDFSIADGSVFFMPKNQNHLNTGYISRSIWNGDISYAKRIPFRLGQKRLKYYRSEGYWSAETPVVTINLEAAFTAYGLIIRFRNTAPQEFVVRTYNQNVLVGESSYFDPDLEFVTYEMFDLFDRMEIEIVRGYPNARVTIDNILIGDVTDYVLSRDTGISGSPTATRQNKIKSISITRYLYTKNNEESDVISEEIVIPAGESKHTLYFNSPCADISAEVLEHTDIAASIVDRSSFFAEILLTNPGAEITATVQIKGHVYTEKEQPFTKSHNENGDTIIWGNPLVSSVSHAKDIEEWLAAYYLGDVDYQIKWRGDPRTDANDLFYLDLKGRDKTLIRCYQNELKFNGSWDGTMKARKAVLSWNG